MHIKLIIVEQYVQVIQTMLYYIEETFDNFRHHFFHNCYYMYYVD